MDPIPDPLPPDLPSKFTAPLRGGGTIPGLRVVRKPLTGDALKKRNVKREQSTKLQTEMRTIHKMGVDHFGELDTGTWVRFPFVKELIALVFAQVGK
jgi:hypothetical protein